MTIFAQTEEPRGAPALSAFDRLPYFKKGTEVKQVSSYRRDNGNPDDSAFNYYKILLQADTSSWKIMRREQFTGFGRPSCTVEISEYILTVSHRRVSINQLPVFSPAHPRLSLHLWSVMIRFPPAGFIRTIRYHSGKASEWSSLPSLPITILRTIPITVQMV